MVWSKVITSVTKFAEICAARQPPGEELREKAPGATLRKHQPYFILLCGWQTIRQVMLQIRMVVPGDRLTKSWNK
jgi:hypothetical protein